MQCINSLLITWKAKVKEKWNGIIADGLKTGRSAPGKGFLYDLDKAIKVSGKPNMTKHKELYQLICEVSI